MGKKVGDAAHNGMALMAAALALGAAASPTHALQPAQGGPGTVIEFVKVDKDITLRRMVVSGTRRKGTVLLLHGFPETIHAWTAVSRGLAEDYEVHAFDWPGFGQSSRPAPDRFAYAPRDYARVLRQYIAKAGIDRSTLTIYATDIGALPALLAALEEPGVASQIIVGDFAPFNRPQYMQERLQRLKSKPSSGEVRDQLNASRDEILANAFTRGLPPEARFDVDPDFQSDMAFGWNHGALTSADAFYHYYSHFTRDQDHLESSLAHLRTPVKVVWGEQDLYIQKQMGLEFADRIGARISLLPGIGHYPHLQNPGHAIAEIRASFRSRTANNQR